MKKLLALLGAILALVVGVPATSSAGGWVVVSLDSAPQLREGEEVAIGFTVLRHGVTPENNEGMVVVLTDERGQTESFPVVQQGALGHHVVTITVPAAGSYTWKLIGSSFMDAELGPIVIDGEKSGGTTTWTWNVLQWGSATLAVGMAGLAGLDVLRSRRHRGAAAAAA